MLRKFSLAVFLGLVAGVVGAQPPAAPQPAKPPAGVVEVAAPNVKGGKVKLAANRDQLRAGPGTKTARLHPQIRAGIASGAFVVPATWDWTKNDSIAMPLLGNGQYGNCYPVAALHQVQAFTGMNGVTTTFTDQQAISWYLRLSPGDSGTSDADIFPELIKGIPGPNGPHKALDKLIVPGADPTTRKLMGWAFGPQLLTFLVHQNFMSVGPGTILTGNTGGVAGGHAVTLNGPDPASRERLQTWGIHPSVLATEDWLRGVQPEVISVFSLEWFDKRGYAPNGQHFTALAPLWNSLGGNVSLVSPFPPPAVDPPTPPLPPAPPTPPPAVSAWVGPDQDVRMLLYDASGKVVYTTQLTRGSIVMHPQAVPPKATFTDAEVIAAGLKYAGASDNKTAISPAKLLQVLAVIAANRAAGKSFLQNVLDVAAVLALPSARTPAAPAELYDVGFGVLVGPAGRPDFTLAP